MTFETLPELRGLDKERLHDADGLKYREFCRSLAPRYAVVWMQIAAGYLALTAIVCAQLSLKPAWIWIAPSALGMGYVLAYLHLFLHEAAHWNLAPSRRWNDLLANLLLGSFLGIDVRSYRPIHWEHHRHLGTTHDTERSYFEALNTRFVVEALTGIRVLRVLKGRRRALESAATQEKQRRSRLQPLCAAVLNTTLLSVLVAVGAWPLALSWALALGVIFPLLASVRQVLEHRSIQVRATTDFTAVDHGVVNRLFGSGPLASTLGGAGFNRHLLHHLEPQLSCTRLAEFERYLMRTECRTTLDAHRTTYLRTLRDLFRAGKS